MCGIFGILSPSLPDQRMIRQALDSMRHRGPDDEGYFFVNTADNSCLVASGPDTCREFKERSRDISETDPAGYDLLLAHRRLAILDLSSKGHQPMRDASGTLWIIYNGEIFNYREIRAELQMSGYEFSSGSDTEVILAAYQEWGEGCVRRFNGQWAFCIYDAGRKRLFCSRDRFGIKPFYYWHDGSTFAFASEMGALKNLPFVHATLNRAVISQFLLFYVLENAQETHYRGICELLPSHNLFIDQTEKSLRIEKYYQSSFNPELGKYDHQQALRYADDIRDILIDAVKIRMVSDVPVGSCLSGGLDSSSIVAIINKLLREGGISPDQIGERQKTFSASYDDPAVDERIHIDRVIAGTNIEGHFCYPNAQTMWGELDRFLSHQNDLCYSTNVYAGWSVMRLASRHVKVVLNGQGGDELFAGYRLYEAPFLADLIREGDLKNFLFTMKGLSHRYGAAYALWRGMMGVSLAVVPYKHHPWLFTFWYRNHHKAVERLMGCPFPLDGPLKWMTDRVSSLNNHLFCDTTRDWLPHLLHYDDRNAAAFSIENRVPFVDHRLIEYVQAIPSIYKVYRGWSKWLLRLAMKDLLPEKIIWRKDKLGFPTPSKSWLQHALSPVPEVTRRYGMSEYGDFAWRLYLGHRLLYGGQSHAVLEKTAHQQISSS